LAATKRPRKPAEAQREDHHGVPRSGGDTPARKSVAPRRTGARAVPKEHGQVQEPLPSVPAVAPSVPLPQPRNHPVNDPNVWRAAIERAYDGGKWQDTYWDPQHEQWCVPSASHPDRTYRVWRRRGNPQRSGYWWDVYECNCDAERQGKRVCWHKAATFLRRKHMTRFPERGTGRLR